MRSVKKYFNGSHCNPDWQDLESPEAKLLRGRGWFTFRKTVRAERGNSCERCGVPELTKEEKALLTREERHKRELHLHHVKKLKTHRHLRFERSNVIVCCQTCHKELEKSAITLSDKEEAMNFPEIFRKFILNYAQGELKVRTSADEDLPLRRDDPNVWALAESATEFRCDGRWHSKAAFASLMKRRMQPGNVSQMDISFLR